jgi:predicted transcriptional regulator
MEKTDNTPATKEDVKQIVTKVVGELAVMMKKGFDDVDRRFGVVDKKFESIDQKFDDVYEYIDKSIEKSAEETRRHFDVVAENIHVDVARANKDEILSIKKRVEVLEEKVGV